MTRSKYINIMAQVADFKPYIVKRVKIEAAESTIKALRKADEYEIKCGYKFPYGLPKYFI